MKQLFAIRYYWFSFAVILLLQFAASSADAQSEVLTAVASKLQQHNTSSLPEKLYVQTDKNFYVSGETLWLKLYNTDGFYNRPLHVSKVAYVDMIDNTGKAVVQQKISLRNGAAGSLQLPLTLNTGNYTLRAYTRWMKNAGAQSFFEKDIVVFNPFQAPDSSAIPATKQTATVVLFPEGGNLVKGLESKVAFKISDAYGQGLEGKGVIVDENNETVAQFQPLKFGMGNFQFTPKQTTGYKVMVVLNDGTSVTAALPAIFEKGYVMAVSNEANEKIKVSITTNASADENVYLVVHTRGLLKVTDKAVVNNGTAVFYIDKVRLSDGVSQFTLFNGRRQPLCERLYFRKPENKHDFSVSTDQQVYDTRDKVSLSFTALDSANRQLSLSVFKYDSLQKADGMNIKNYLWLTSDLTGKIEAPDYYFSDDALVNEASDNLMLTHGWRRFKWEDIFNANEQPQLAPEFNGHIVAARITDSATHQPAQHVQAYLSVPDTLFQLYTSRTDSNGMAYFDVENYFGEGEIVVQARPDGVHTYKVEIVSPFAPADAKLSLSSAPFGAAVPLLENYSVDMQVQKLYHDTTIFISPKWQDTLPFYGVPQFTYYLDDYTRFVTMEEVLREYVRPINVSQRGGKFYMRMFDPLSQQFFENNILLMVDGIPIFDQQKVFQYNPKKVKRLDVIPKSYFLGTAPFKGVASFSTYTGDYKGLELSTDQIVFDYAGLQKQRAFYTPVYETAVQSQSRLPDFRTTLYWNPNVEIKNAKDTISFYASDKEGSYLGVLEGIDSEGNPVVEQFKFDVKKGAKK